MMNKKNKSLIVICFFLLTACSKTRSFYENSAQIECQSNHWIPEFVKKNNTSSISIFSDLDTNEVWGKFNSMKIDYLVDIGSDEKFNVNERKISRLNKLGLKNTDNSIRFNIEYSNSNWLVICQEDKKGFVIYYYGRFS